jgi:hypothetical protein
LLSATEILVASKGVLLPSRRTTVSWIDRAESVALG